MHRPGLAALFVAGSLAGQALPEPATAPERTAFRDTSTHLDLLSFLSELTSLPHGSRLAHASLAARRRRRDS